MIGFAVFAVVAMWVFPEAQGGKPEPGDQAGRDSAAGAGTMQMALPPLPELALFMALVLVLSLYGLTVSGHFPEEHRAASLRTGGGPLLLWGTIALCAALALAGPGRSPGSACRSMRPSSAAAPWC